MRCEKEESPIRRESLPVTDSGSGVEGAMGTRQGVQS